MNWVREIANWMVIVWLLAAMVIHWGRRLDRDGLAFRFARAVFWELRPFFLPAVLIKAALTIVALKFDWVDAFTLGCNLLNWWILKDPKDDDDDRWKRRREKAQSVVQVAGTRLVVAPVGAR